MSSTTIRSTVAAAIALACLGTAGCAITKDEKPSPQSTSTSREPAPSTPTVTVTTTQTATPSPTPTATATGPEAALLSAAEFPRVNATTPWTQQGTAPAGTTPFGLCQKFDLGTIGATSTLERTFAAGSDTAGQQLAEFADAQTAVRASRVVQSWHDDCQGRVPGRNVRVRPGADVAVTRGKGWWYYVDYTRGGAGHFHALGMALSGTRLTLLRIDQTAQDRTYPPGKDPMELAVKAAAAKLGG